MTDDTSTEEEEHSSEERIECGSTEKNGIRPRPATSRHATASRAASHNLEETSKNVTENKLSDIKNSSKRGVERGPGTSENKKRMNCEALREVCTICDLTQPQSLLVNTDISQTCKLRVPFCLFGNNLFWDLTDYMTLNSSELNKINTNDCKQ